MDKIIARDSLVGLELADSIAWCHEAAQDSDGFTDYHELDILLDQHDDFERDVEAFADVAAVFAEESLRFS